MQDVPKHERKFMLAEKKELRYGKKRPHEDFYESKMGNPQPIPKGRYGKTYMHFSKKDAGTSSETKCRWA